MSTKVKERLKKLALEMTHEERLELDEMLDKMAMKMGIILVTDQSDKAKQRGCDVLIEEIPDDKLREIVRRIKKKKRRKYQSRPNKRNLEGLCKHSKGEIKTMCKIDIKNGDTRIDPCMRKEIEEMNKNIIITLACCCGHGKYPKTIVIKSLIPGDERAWEIFSKRFIPRKKKFYKRDKQGRYYIPETI